jgi:hypothetical protein
MPPGAHPSAWKRGGDAGAGRRTTLGDYQHSKRRPAAGAGLESAWSAGSCRDSARVMIQLHSGLGSGTNYKYYCGYRERETRARHSDTLL